MNKWHLFLYDVTCAALLVFILTVGWWWITSN